MKLIDADRLLQRTKFYNLKNGNRAIDEIDILHAPTVQAIPLDKIKQAREEIENINPIYSTIGDRIPVLKNCDDIKAEVLAILDKLIESEG